MSEINSATNSDWIRLNVGGKTFQTTKDTLSRYPNSFLARLVNGAFSSDKDGTGAILIDRSYKHFDTILDYLRTGIVNFDHSENVIKELSCEADFYGLQVLVEEINKPVRTAPNHTEIVIVSRDFSSKRFDHKLVDYIGYFFTSEKRDDYEVLQALRQKVMFRTDNSDGNYKHYNYIIDRKYEWMNNDAWLNIELILRSFGFVKEEISQGEFEVKKGSKYVRTVRQ